VKRPLWFKALAGLAFWMVVATIFAANSHFMRMGAGRPSSLPQFVSWYLFSWAFWWPGSAGVLALTRVAPLDRKHWKLGALAHLGGAVACILLMTAWDAFLVHSVSGVVDFSLVLGKEVGQPFVEIFRSWLPSEASWGLLVYAGVLAAAHAREYYVGLREEELAASRLTAQLTDARLQLLTVQLQPHFLFNTLNAVATLVHSDPDTAERMIIRLSELLRQALASSDRNEVPLEEELDLLRSYVDIEQLRFGERLAVHFDIEPGSRDVLVPQLALQLLVENALRHGFTPEVAVARIEVRSRLRNDFLELEVWDNGRGLAATADGNGLGLSNIRQRLGAMYGSAQYFAVSPAQGGGVVATITIPARRMGDGEPSGATN